MVTTEQIAIMAAGLGVVGSIVYALLLGRGVRHLGQIRDAVRDSNRR